MRVCLDDKNCIQQKLEIFEHTILGGGNEN
jgi:hypothetical protein